MPCETEIAEVRSFNRFYTRQIGLLDEGWLKSEFSLTEVRVLYELAQDDEVAASTLSHQLDLDSGYLSRILKKFERRKLITRTASRTDARRSLIALTDAGRAIYAPLERASSNEIASLLESIDVDAREKVIGSMATLQRLLGGRPSPTSPFIIRNLKPGDLGWITHRHGVLYHREYGWDETFEAFVAEIVGRFGLTNDPACERVWIAEREGEIVGSVFVVRNDDTQAKLRLLYVEPSARGLGIGRRLLDEAIDFARDKNYRSLTLWTNDILVSARRIYEAAGFQLVSEQPHNSFGKDLVGQNWTLNLNAP